MSVLTGPAIVRRVAEIIRELTDAVARAPDLYDEAGAWRGEGKPPGGLSPPFPADAVNERLKRCIVIGVRIDRNAPDGFSRIDDTMMAEIMGRH